MANDTRPPTVDQVLRAESNAVAAIIVPAVFTLYDHALTFVDEVQLIWPRKLTVVSYIFLLNRYVMFVKMILLFQTTWASSVSSCEVGLVWYNALDSLELLVIAVFNPIRVWALWDKKWRIFIPVFLFSLFSPAYCTYRISQASFNHVSKLAPPVGGCLIGIGVPLPIWLGFGRADRALSITLDGVILALTWWKTYRIYKSSIEAQLKPTVTALLLRDGTIYFGTMLVVNTVMLATEKPLSTIFPISGTSTYLSTQVVGLRLIWVTSLNSILLSRFIMNLRGSYQQHLDPNTRVTPLGGLDIEPVMQTNLNGVEDSVVPEQNMSEQSIAADHHRDISQEIVEEMRSVQSVHAR